MNNDRRSVFYNDAHARIVENGVDTILAVLDGDNISEKESLLLCLDKYLDPYFGYELPHANEIFLLLEKQLFEDHPIFIKNDILSLLELYCTIPLHYMEKDLSQIDASLSKR